MSDRATKRWDDHFRGIALAAAVIAFFSTGEIAQMNQARVALVGLAFGIALIFLWDGDAPHSLVSPKTATTISAAAVLLGGLVFTYEGFQADRSISANLQRCEAIQRDMLSAHPLRSDGPDLFQALGCRPQGQGSVHAPPSEAMIEVHEWLPWGGIGA